MFPTWQAVVLMFIPFAAGETDLLGCRLSATFTFTFTVYHCLYLSRQSIPIIYGTTLLGFLFFCGVLEHAGFVGAWQWLSPGLHVRQQGEHGSRYAAL